MNKKILLISNMYPSKNDPTYGVFVKNFKDQMEQEYFDITQTALIRGRGKNKFTKMIKYIKFFKDVIILIKQNKYDLIYVHYIGHSLLPLLFVQKAIKKPLILNAHGSDIFSTNKIQKYIQNLVTPIIKNSNMIVVPSHYFEDIIHNKFQIEKNKIFISPSGGIDTALFSPLHTKKNDDEFVIGYVSRIDEGKGSDTLLEAIKLLLDKDTMNFKVLIIGGGNQEEKLLNMIEDLNLGNHVDFIGKVPHKELVYYYNQMDVFTFTTRLNESLGLVGLEAMSCGIPVIGSNIFALREYIFPNTNGDLFEINNPKDLFIKLDNFISLPVKKKKSLSDAARNTALIYEATKTAQNLNLKITQLIHKMEHNA